MFFINHDEQLNQYTNKTVSEYEELEGEVISYLAFYSYEKQVDIGQVKSQTRSSSEQITFNIPDLLKLLETGMSVNKSITTLRNEFTRESELLNDDEFNLRWFIPGDTIPKITKYLKDNYNV
jgi:hypothetical protein